VAAGRVMVSDEEIGGSATLWLSMCSLPGPRESWTDPKIIPFLLSALSRAGKISECSPHSGCRLVQRDILIQAALCAVLLVYLIFRDDAGNLTTRGRVLLVLILTWFCYVT
jgi:hypothetical protein